MDKDYLTTKQKLNSVYGLSVTDGEIKRAVKLHNELKKAATNGDPLAAILTTPIDVVYTDTDSIKVRKEN